MELHAPPAVRSRAFVTIATLGSILILAFAITAKIPTYRVNPVFLIPLTWLPFLLCFKLNLQPIPYAMFVLAILFHDLGAFGFYRSSPLPWSFDIYVHYYFAIPVTLILYHAIETHMPLLRRWQVAVTSMLFMMGVGALHEIMEYMTYLLLGEEKGMLKPSTSYFFDTQRDLTNNLLGTLTALLLLAIANQVSRKRKQVIEAIAR